MKRTVMLKSNASGITLVLDAEIPFNQLLEDTIHVFNENKDFFENSRFAIAFSGRTLTEDEEIQMVLTINEHTNANVIRWMSNDEMLERQFQFQQQQFEQMISNNTGKFHKGTLKDKDVLEVSSSVVILGDVEAGAKVISCGNVVVLGTLSGTVFAGGGGNEDAFIAALVFEPEKMKIADLTYVGDKKKNIFSKRNNKINQPQVATIQGGRIEVSPIISK